MAATKLAILSLFFALILTPVRADDVSTESDDEAAATVDSSAFKIELDRLKSKIHALG